MPLGARPPSDVCMLSVPSDPSHGVGGPTTLARRLQYARLPQPAWRGHPWPSMATRQSLSRETPNRCGLAGVQSNRSQRGVRGRRAVLAGRRRNADGHIHAQVTVAQGSVAAARKPVSVLALTRLSSAQPGRQPARCRRERLRLRRLRRLRPRPPPHW